MTTFRDAIIATAPPWLRTGTAGGILYTCGTMVDALGDWLSIGIRSRFPDYASPDALGYIGNDRKIVRGPSELDASYRPRLREAVDAWRVAGSARSILGQLAGFFSDTNDPPLRLVTARAVWHTWDWTTRTVTRTDVGTNWNWAGAVEHGDWYWAWVIIDCTDGPWTATRIGDFVIGEAPIGSSISSLELANLRTIVGTWKPAHIRVENIVIAFDASLYLPSNASPPNPDGSGYTDTWKSTQNAIFYKGIE